MKKYDFHSHLGKTTAGDKNSAEQLVEQLSSFGISKVGICCTSGNDMVAQNDVIYDAMCKYPDFVVGYADINPKDPDVFKEIDRTLGTMKMNGVKIFPWKHGYSVDNCPQINDVIDAISKYDVHIQIHGGASPLCTPFVWIDYAKKKPNTKFVFTHICGREFGYSVIEALKDVPNFWVETSANEEADILKRAVQVLGSQRVLMGTDWPYKPTNIELLKLELLNLSNEDYENIYYKNAEKLWGLK